MIRHSLLEDRQRRKSLLIAAALVGAGFILAAWSWELRENDPWWSAMLTNVSVVLLLLAPGEYFLTQLRSSFERVRTLAHRAEATADAAQRTAEETARSLADVRQVLLDRQLGEHEAELDIYRAVTQDMSRDVLLRALLHATQTGVISPAGVRSPIFETNLHYRYVATEPSALQVRLETDAGRVLSSCDWAEGMSAEEFYQILVLAVREAGHDLGVGLNDPTDSVEDLVAMLMEVTRLRAQELRGHRQSLRRIIERVDGWYFTEEYVIPADNLRYTIGVDRLDEMDWEEHLRGKEWWGAATAIPFARQLYRNRAPADSIQDDDADIGNLAMGG